MIITQPNVDNAQRLCVQLTDPSSPLVLGHDQTDAPQLAKMFWDRRTTGAKIAGELTNRVLAVPQEAEDLAAGRIGDGSEYCFALLWFLNGHVSTICNHEVTRLVTDRLR